MTILEKLKLVLEQIHDKAEERKERMRNEDCTKLFKKESVLYGRKEDYGKGDHASQRGMSSAEGVCIYQQLE